MPAAGMTFNNVNRMIPADLHHHLREHAQEHVLAWWDRLPESEREELQRQLRAVDLPLLRRLYGERDKRFALPPADKIAPVPVIRRDADATAAMQLGTHALERGAV